MSDVKVKLTDTESNAVAASWAVGVERGLRRGDGRRWWAHSVVCKS